MFSILLRDYCLKYASYAALSSLFSRLSVLDGVDAVDCCNVSYQSVAMNQMSQTWHIECWTLLASKSRTYRLHHYLDSAVLCLG